MAGRWVLAGCGGAVLAAGAAVSEMAGAGFGARGRIENIGWIDLAAWALMVVGGLAVAKAAVSIAHLPGKARHGR